MTTVAQKSARRVALDGINVGDVIYGIAGGGQQKILLVVESDARHIVARHITSQGTVEFDRDGFSIRAPNRGSCRITSTAALPLAERETAVGLDRKMRTARQHPDFVLNESEKRLILTGPAFFEAHPLPEI